MWAILGDITFELLRAPETADLSARYTYAEHQVIEGKPKLQWTGDALDERNWTIRLHRVFCDPDAVLATLRAVSARHQALPLSLGTGEYLGRFVIPELHALSIVTDADGGTLAATADIKFKEWAGTDSSVASSGAGEAVEVPSGQPVAGTIKLSDVAQAKLETASPAESSSSSTGPFSFSAAEKEMGL